MTTPREVSRRSVLQGAGAAAALLAVGGLSPEAARAAVAETARAGVFGFGVASGDPTGTSVLLWTRVTPDPAAVPGSGLGAPTRVRWEVAADEGFRHVLRRGTVRSDPARDHTVEVVVDRLDPYTRYHHRFSALGRTSPVGRTQTSPDEPGTPHALRLAFVSCSNYTGGWFTAYRGLAARDDLDLVLHLGDYVYEYGNGEDRYGPDALAGTRDHQPPAEMVSLADYRVRHALYEADPDLQAAHAGHPWVTIFDDHEITNDAYDTGAEIHEPADDPDTAYTGPMEPPGVLPEGDFPARRERASRAYLEWMPIREPGALGEHPHRGTQFFRRFRFGDPAALSVVDTRQNRSRQVPATAGGTLNPALADPARVLPEPEQLDWLVDGVTGGGTAWHLIGNQTVFTRVYAVPRAGVLPGQVSNTDQWDGCQDDQGRLLAAMAASGDTDPVVLTGDIHSSWANDLPTDPDGHRVDGRSSVGVESLCPSVTSDGFTEVLGSAAAAQTATAAFQTANPWVRYLEGHRPRLRRHRRGARPGADRLLVHPQRRGRGPGGRPAAGPAGHGRPRELLAVGQGQPPGQRAGRRARTALGRAAPGR
ncbi:alkaline phosphatase D [Geodermatophilus pulveris]|uniref:Alkaline phosphatase D n=1 Tax=Geodermatophilus pulveris TaxID=1564159 RepID=A0A239DEE7_9ACTN|nr:alkaline phosphatase D family protein [Geodermatophilus pulveris]SNS30710.1 alkaline phosphatase D [Geodermatophilus pulveris]